MIAAIEDAILAALQTVNDGRLGYKFATLGTYGGEFDDDLSQVIRRLPGVWVVYVGGGKPVPYGTSKTRWKMPATFATLVGARNVRGEPATRRGVSNAAGVVEVGAYQMLEDTRRALLNQDFGLQIARFEPGTTRTLYTKKLNELAMSVFTQEWHTAFLIDPAPGDPNAPDWLTLKMDYYLQPDDGVADASDIVTLNP